MLFGIGRLSEGAAAGVRPVAASETVFQRELNVTRALRILEQDKRGSNASGGRVQDRRVGQVNELAAEFQPLALGYGEEFRKSEVQGFETRAADCAKFAGLNHW